MAQVHLFEGELAGLKEEVKASKEEMKRESEKAALAIEKANTAASNRRRPAVGGIKSSANSAVGIAGSAKKSLKFNKGPQSESSASQNQSTAQINI